MNESVSIIIPTLNAEKDIEELINTLNRQTVRLSEIVVVDSESDDSTLEICRKFDNVRIIQIARSEFDHGKTRDMAFRTCHADYVLFITQDALPNNEFYIEKLLAPFSNEKVAISTGRQIARDDAYPMEKLVREFNYPAESHVRSKADLSKYGIKTFSFSDVCAAYRRDVYLELGGFEYPLKTNEDMFFAAKVINSGYMIAYAADAEVIHSHNFTLRQQYRRNYLIGMELKKHEKLLNNVSVNSEGFRLLKYVLVGLLKHGRIFSFVHFMFDCCARFLGNFMGKRSK